MALKGNLRDFTITQLLNLINLARKTGTLVIQAHPESAQVFFREGKLAYAQINQVDNGLVDILYKAKKLSAHQYRIIKERAKDMSDKELGLLLINANYLTQQEILTSLQNQYIGVVNRLLALSEGFFNFESDRTPPNGVITIRANLENLIIEGARRMREREQLQDEIPSLDMGLKFADRPGANIRNVNLSVKEWRVVSYINPKNTMRQIARANNLSDFELRRIVYGLLQAGLVEIVRPAGAPQPVPKPGRIPVSSVDGTKEERKSLVNRIISRIRSL
jgi:hypothetical protein